jgi:hypothetical protein
MLPTRDDVDYSGRTVRLELGRRSREDLDAFDVIRWLPTPAHRAIIPTRSSRARVALPVTHSYLEERLHNARVLAANQQPGDGFHSPWPFRADYRTAAGRGPVSGNMTYILRLYDALQAHGYPEFTEPQRALWRWIKHYQIPSAAADGALFAQFFEDHDVPSNRTAWAPLNLARYLLERRTALEPHWRTDAGTLIHFVRSTFTHLEFGVRVCHEQDEDRETWGGVNSTYGAVLALYAKAVGSAVLASEARQALNFTLYSIDDAGRPRDLFKRALPGGWQEDAHTDVIHNYVDALRAFPAWAETHLSDPSGR